MTSVLNCMADPFLRYRQLVLDVAEKLSKSNCEGLVHLYRLPEEKYSGATALRVLKGLEELGILWPTQPEMLKEVVQRVKRNDLTKEIDKHIKDWAKQDKKRPSAEGDAATNNGKKLLSVKDASFKARFDHVILQAECLAKHIEELRGMLSADDDEAYHGAERILCEIQEKTDDLKFNLKKARSTAKLGETAFAEPQIQETSNIACFSDPPRRKSYIPGKQL